MADSFTLGALLGHVYPLDDGSCVRLRLARSSDIEAVRDLLSGRGLELDAARLVHFDPRRSYVICATALIDGTEQLVGIGAIALDGDAAAPQLLIVEDDHAGEVAPLLGRALIRTVELIDRSRAA